MEGRTIVYADECMFTVSTVTRGAYSARGANITVQENVAYQEALAVVGGVSEHNGFEGYLIRPRSIDSDSFIAFIENLTMKNPERPLALFMDNCSVHHSRKVKAHLREKDITAIYNLPYSPQYNPIERVWAVGKRTYKMKKLSAVTSGIKPNHRRILMESLNSIEQSTINSICRKVL